MSGISKVEADRRAVLAAGRQALFVAALLLSVASIVAGVWVISKAWTWQLMTDDDLANGFGSFEGKLYPATFLRGCISIINITATLGVCLGFSAMVDWKRHAPNDIWLARAVRFSFGDTPSLWEDVRKFPLLSGYLIGGFLVFDATQDWWSGKGLSWKEIVIGVALFAANLLLLDRYGEGSTIGEWWKWWREQPSKRAATLPITDQPFVPKRFPLTLRLPSVGMPVDLRSLLRFGRTSSRAAALIDASRCWGAIFGIWIIVEQFVPVWSYEAFPTDERAYVWYAAFAVMGVTFGGYIYLSRKAKGPADYRLMGRAILQLGIGAGVLLVGAWLGGKLGADWPDNTFGLIAIWLLVTATARIITLPWFPSFRQLRRR